MMILQELEEGKYQSKELKASASAASFRLINSVLGGKTITASHKKIPLRK